MDDKRSGVIKPGHLPAASHFDTFAFEADAQSLLVNALTSRMDVTVCVNEELCYT